MLADKFLEKAESAKHKLRRDRIDIEAKMLGLIKEVMNDVAENGKTYVRIHLIRHQRVNGEQASQDSAWTIWGCGNYDYKVLNNIERELVKDGFRCNYYEVYKKGNARMILIDGTGFTEYDRVNDDYIIYISWGKGICEIL
jgi:hypothetical protein